jgi:N-acylglucosamine-6-phosphate 2-epimerase
MNVLDVLRGGLIVSVQAPQGSAIDDPHVLAAMAASAQESGAVGVRMQGVTNLEAARMRISIPIIGLIKKDYPGFEPYITPTLDDVRAVAQCGAQIVAFDATGRTRPGGETVETLVAAIHAEGCLAMADCANAGDGMCAAAAGAEILATTLCGYTADTRGATLPALALLRELAELGAFAICEGGIAHPEGVTAAFDAGAQAVVVGTAITNTGWLVGEFASRAPKSKAGTTPKPFP